LVEILNTEFMKILQIEKKLAELIRYHTTKTGDKMCTLKDYISRMKEGQDKIYYITGENRKSLENSPFVEGFKKERI